MTNLDRVSKPSGNWLSLRKRLRATSPSPHKSRNKRQKRSEDSSRASNSSNVMPSVSPSPTGNSSLHGDSVETLRSLIFSPIPFPPDLPPKDRQPGQYIALDCEMVGVGPAGTESTLARVSVVNYFGAVLLDEFVRQKERVTDWRTQWSGIREKDMINAKIFEEVQSAVAELIKDRILIGHAIQNDLKALMLSHPRAQIRDTQHLAHRHGQTRSARPALRNLVHDMLGAKIQQGEHNSVTDARATLAIYRLHRKQWEKGYAVIPIRVPYKAKEKDIGDQLAPEPEISQRSSGDDRSRRTSLPSRTSEGKTTYRKGVSSGLSTIVRHRSKVNSGVGGSKNKWWSELGGAQARDGSKGSIRVVT